MMLVNWWLRAADVLAQLVQVANRGWPECSAGQPAHICSAPLWPLPARSCAQLYRRAELDGVRGLPGPPPEGVRLFFAWGHGPPGGAGRQAGRRSTRVCHRPLRTRLDAGCMGFSLTPRCAARALPLPACRCGSTSTLCWPSVRASPSVPRPYPVRETRVGGWAGGAVTWRPAAYLPTRRL